MSIKKLDRSAWAAHFDAFSKEQSRARRVDYAEIRVLSMEEGAQQETSWLPLKGITYDHRDDLLEIIVENVDHLVFAPAEIYVDETDEGVIKSLEVVDREGVRHLVELR